MTWRDQLAIWLPQVTWLLFVVAVGACVGSLVNVLVYRMPRGLSVVSPPSRCPSCQTRLTWRENIPVLGWLLLRGRCRFCKSPISAEYPLVEAFVAALFGVIFVLFFMVDRGTFWLGLNISMIRPDWAQNPGEMVWPTFVILLVLLGSLTAMTLVDFKTFTIPMALTATPAVVGLVVHPVHAAWIEHGTRAGRLYVAAGREVWTIPTPGPIDWWWIGAALGAALGLVASNALMALGLIRRSFADYEEWEKSHNPTPEAPAAETSAGAVPEERASAEEAAPTQLSGLAEGPPAAACPPSDSPAIERPTAQPSLAPRLLPIGVCTAALGVLGALVAWAMGYAPGAGLLIGLPVGVLLGGAVVSRSNRNRGQPQETPATAWIAYPHARREMLKELIFLTPVVALGLCGGWVAERVATGEAPLWLLALSGSIIGFLVGGAVVWSVRILGSLAFGREAMGLGDVHLMAGVGACLGWIDATLAFFAGAFVGLYWALAQRAFSGGFARAMPFGPNLAVATLLVILFKPVIELGMAMVMGVTTPIDIP